MFKRKEREFTAKDAREARIKGQEKLFSNILKSIEFRSNKGASSMWLSEASEENIARLKGLGYAINKAAFGGYMVSW